MIYEAHPAQHNNKLLMNVREGMPVFDVERNKLGTVKTIRFAADGGPDMIDPVYQGEHRKNVPQIELTRLLTSGYIEVNAGFLRKDCYVRPEEIDRVTSEGIFLNVYGSQVLRF